MRNHYGVLIFLIVTLTISLIGIGLTKVQIGTAQQQQQQQQPQANLTSTEKQHLQDGISFQIDNVTFSHHMATVNGIQLHYVMGGKGDPVVLLHGWPETWYSWHRVMPDLAKNYTVIVPDLRGLGDSSKPPTGYDGKTVAEDIHQLVGKLGFKTSSLFICSCTSYGSKEVSSNGINNSWIRTCWQNAIVVGRIPSNTRRTRSPCTRKRDVVFIVVLS
jgi:hypothetical protein